MNPIPDLEQRRRALDPARSFIVQAPAGSGKTELLIQRYLLLLARVEHPEEIVAMTFTRKAAGEMCSRVLAALAAARGGGAAASEHDRTTLELARAALARDAAAGWRIGENPARLRIQTIDSLCAELTRQMPVLSRFGAQPQTTDEPADLYLEAARAVIALVADEADRADAARDVERLLDHLDNDVERAEQLLAAMLARRDHWLRRMRPIDRELLEAALRDVRAAALARVRALVPEPMRAELRALAEFAFDRPGSPPFADGEDDWAALAGILITKAGAWRKVLTRKQGFAADGLGQAWKQRAAALLDALAGQDELRDALQDMRRLPPPAYADAQWEALGAIARLLPLAAAQLKLVFQSRGRVDFTEVMHGAALALGAEDAPSDLALALDYRIRHLLIDEFQDTSISQYELIARLTAGWEPGDGRTVFAVGDPMQSIYRFREAEVGLFLRARAEGIGSVGLEPVALGANFRSQAGIVDWVNASFARLLPRHEDIATGAVPYTASVATRAAAPGDAVSVHALIDADPGEEAQRVFDIVERERSADAAARIAILVRSRPHLNAIVARLKRGGVRFRAIEIEALGERPVVQDLLALTRALSHPADRVAWLATLRAPWCGLTLADLHALAGDDHERTLLEAIGDAARVAALSADGRARLARVRDILLDALARRFRGSLRETVAGTWFALGGPACVEDPTDLDDAETFFEHLGQHEEAGEMADCAAFERGLDALYALPDVRADDRLQIMTIHKAKGLEFDCVIAPGLGRSTRGDEGSLFLWAELPRAGAEANLLLAPIHEAGADADPTYDWLRQIETRKQELESVRLLYVAATRARRSLHLIGSVRSAQQAGGGATPRSPHKESLLRKLWPVVEPVFAAAALRGTVPSAAAQPQAISRRDLRRLAADWVRPEAPPRVRWDAAPETAREHAAIEFSWAGATAREVGSVVHRWLQRIADDQLRGWTPQRIESLRATIRKQLLARGVLETDVDAAAARVGAALTAAVTEPRGRWLLGPQPEADNELRLTACFGGECVNLVIDRTFRGADGTRWIVDYKTGSHEGADLEAFLERERERYREQLERYAAALGAPGDTRLGLYFPLLGGWREWRGSGE